MQYLRIMILALIVTEKSTFREIFKVIFFTYHILFVVYMLLFAKFCFFSFFSLHFSAKHKLYEALFTRILLFYAFLDWKANMFVYLSDGEATISFSENFQIALSCFCNA